ncbi:thyroid receptor-interacting protein 11 isoform X2 [Drosophila eugracilis]|nr:thyroid receptor-interacting protein 11 isoform X2 [Drosophila eugracilis]XP_017074362.1 thyroid receptor-interacting protein 11 isoform X2 [Drosophila eugracilis]
MARLNNRIAELEQLNAQLNASLEELDSQHELAMQDVLTHKSQLVGQVANLKQMQADRLVEHELANARQQKQMDELRQASAVAKELQEQLQQKVEQQEAELKRSVVELAEMQELLDKRGQDNAELIERVRLAETERERLLKDLEESRQAKEKKTSESSSNSSSTGKHSEDEFIVVRQADATGSGSASGSDPDPEVTSPPTKEKLRDRLVSLESQISELNLTNTQLQDAQLEKQLGINLLGDQLAELEKRLRLSEAEKEQLQLDLQLRLQQLTVQNQELKLHAEAEQEGHAQDLEEQLGALREENQRLRQELDTSIAQAKFRQAIAEEKQEITDLDETDTEYGTYELDKLRALLQAEVDNRLGSSYPQQKLERAWNSLTERWHRLDLVEQRLVDVQNQQLVSEHEKKTLEADISQYILQCDELMKNNELLLNELDKYKRNKLETIEEHHEETIVQLEAQLEEARQRLEASLSSQRQLETKLKSDQEKPTQDSELLARLEQKVQEEFQLQEQLSSVRKELDSKALLLDEQLAKQEQQNQANHENLAELRESLQHKEAELKSLEEQLTSVRQELEEKSIQIKINQDQHKLQLTKIQNQLQADQEKLREQLQLQDKLEQQKELMEVDQNQQLTTIKKELAEVTHQLDECQEKLAAKEAQLAEIQQQLLEVSEEKTKLEGQVLSREQESGKDTEQSKLIQELQDQLLSKEQDLHENQAELGKLQEALQSYEKQLQAKEEQLQAKEEQLQAKESQLQAKESQLESHQAADQSQHLQQTIDGLGQEKNELIKALQQKHQETTQYYAEIQRLQPFEQQLKDLVKEREKLQDQIVFLKEKSDILTTNLLTEQTNQRLLHQQQAESQEQQASVQRDLERLRAHLLEVEELHTQESVELQRDLEESRSRQAVLEQQVSKSSTAYTSASIRANQQAETLQAQHALLQQQRDELLTKLGQYEDRELKQQAALTNLQCALEQFQNDQDHDIEMATQRIRREMQTQLDRQGQLQLEMGGLQQQLAEANQGLRAAARLSDQLEAGQQTIAVLRDEVESLKEANAQLEQSLSSHESSQTDKIDKSLIKSLLIGYVVSGHAGDKQQVLRMISSVLDFNAQESDKVGLNKQQSSWLGSILGGGPTPAAGAGSTRGNDNLVQAFVQFLEQESQPQTQSRPTLLSMTGQIDASASSTTSNLPLPTKQNTQLPPTLPGAAAVAASHQDPGTPPAVQGGSPQSLAMGSNEFAPTRNSSSILKDILSDS